MSTPVVPTTGWVCYARPIARHGQRCGHINEGATQNCSECGCAWKASEDRRAKEAAEAPRIASRRREAARIRQRRRQH